MGGSTRNPRNPDGKQLSRSRPTQLINVQIAGFEPRAPRSALQIWRFKMDLYLRS